MNCVLEQLNSWLRKVLFLIEEYQLIEDFRREYVYFITLNEEMEIQWSTKPLDEKLIGVL